MELKTEHPIVVVCTPSEKYTIPLAAMLKSLSINKKTDKELHFYIIANDIKKRNKTKITKSVDTDESGIRVVWMEYHQGVFASLTGNSEAYYLRLLIPDLLPDQFKKCIYLDCDLIVNGDIEELWEYDLDNAPLCAARDPWAPLVSSKNGLLNYKQLGLQHETKYLNSGVLIFNLVLWRNENIGASVIDYIRQNEEYIRFWDQDGLNAILHDRWKELDQNWNYIVSPTLRIERDLQHGHEIDQMEESSPFKIIHFASWPKPWCIDFQHPIERLYFKYVDMTEWAGWRPARRRHLFTRLKNAIIHLR